MSSSKRSETASSPAIAIVLMLIITFILGALVLLLMVQLPWPHEESVPAIFTITKIRHENEYGRLTYDSRMMVKNAGDTGYQNLNLYALTYRNGELLLCAIDTVNGHDFISTHHYKIQNLGGAGSRGATWDPGELIYIDYADRTFHPDDVVTFEVYDVVTDKIISRHTFTA